MTMVERLADKGRPVGLHGSLEDEARWYLNSIADELAYPHPDLLLTRMEAARFREVSRWLRSQTVPTTVPTGYSL